MKPVTAVAAVAGGVVVGALIGYAVWGRGPTGNPHAAVIELQGTAGQPCRAKVDPFLIGNKRTMKVYWSVDSATAPCQPDGNWEIELRFDNSNDGNGATWNNGNVVVRANGITIWRIPDGANYGRFPYHVWMRPPSGAAYEMADPELQIEQ